jgi:(1->4)-alpha-D-glucan 1-alpha-D-glucosylmutase
MTDLDLDQLVQRAMRRAMEMRRLPESTYRVQLHKGFTFRDAAAIVPYLADLGITHLYASPYLRATPGSTHGYDVIDHASLNPELGTRADFDALLAALERHGMSHILDTVPNHVGVATNDNAWWNDVLEHGPRSRYAGYFDITWRDTPRRELDDKVLLPVLGGHYGDVLEKGELQLTYEDGRLAVNYYARRFPIDPRTDSLVLDHAPGSVERSLAAFNGRPGDPRSFDLLDELLNRQNYRLAYWRVASDEINYRRFFDINDLAALSMERDEVFRDTHVLILGLLAESKLAGLRIDHPDGLYDPEKYFRQLQRHHVLNIARALVSSDPALANTDWDSLKTPLLDRIDRALPSSEDARADWPAYVVAEKILAPDEPLPPHWAVDGTSGYDFLNKVNGLFVDTAAAEAFSWLYHQRIGDATPFADLVYRKKRLILEIALASELQMLTGQLDRIAQSDRHTRDFTHNGLRHALREVIACFPVYRTYVSDRGLRASDVAHVEAAVGRAIARNPKTDASIFRFVRDTLLLRRPAETTADQRAARVRFAGKFQQVTAPTTAKGIEDTAFYVYNRFVSLNEVGGEPDFFGVPPDALHAYLADRQARWPYALSALSTHDTKRSEDVRARLNVLSELPEEWAACTERWALLNESHRTDVAGQIVPGPNEEYLLYQTLLGAWPLDGRIDDVFVARIRAYMQKALREAKVFTSWTDPNAPYEEAVAAFIGRILDPQTGGPFLADFGPFQRRIADLGLVNSLAQTLLRLTAPGVPDTYQGTELWDFSLVDPDNRRPVDYDHRRTMLAALTSRPPAPDLARELMASPHDGRLKLLVTWAALQARRRHPGLFSAGGYEPLVAEGGRAAHVFGFTRRDEAGRTAIVLVPRLVTALAAAAGGTPATGEAAWQDTRVRPPLAAGTRLVNALTGERLEAVGEGLSLAGVLADLPVALFISEQ